MKNKKVTNPKLNNILTAMAIILVIVSVSLLSYEYIIKPMQSNKVIEQSKELYQPVTTTPAPTTAPTTEVPKETTKSITEEKLSDYAKSDILKDFSKLLESNADVKGWISIPNTNIDYPVLQSSEDPEYYLRRNIDKKPDKMGSIFLDTHSSVEKRNKNLVIHGHNMTSTGNMFHYLLKYDSINYYKDHPIINFDSIYEKGKWKIISIFKANANITDDFFNYTKSTFKDDADYLDFIYQLRVRSIYNLPVDINENDPIICLSTCSYEVDNYRTVIVARKIREGEDETVDVDKAVDNPSIYYPANWYEVFGGKRPVLEGFPEALKNGDITWYKNK